MTAGPVWLSIEDILDIHAQQLALFGGAGGIRDFGLIESALLRPENLYHYEGERDVLTLAVRLGIGIAENHGFVDGNKRTGAAAMIELLAVNGYVLTMPNDTTLGRWIEAVIENEMLEQEFIEALSRFTEPWQ
ncbi:MAG TPA: type II toxin-antitoxin system death-on-curing family toxin [Allosphingosinicella sp.]